MRTKRPDSETVDGVEAEAMLQRLAKRYGILLRTAAKRISMSQSTYWRWKVGELRPMPWQVNLLTMSVLELAEKDGTIQADDLAKLNTFRIDKPGPKKPVIVPTHSEVRKLRAQLAEAERLLLAASR